MTVHLTLVAGTASEGQEKDPIEYSGKDILDTAYTKSVAGEVWIKEFLDTMGDKDRKDAEQSKRKAGHYLNLVMARRVKAITS
eukprot:gene756-44_t